MADPAPAAADLALEQLPAPAAAPPTADNPPSDAVQPTDVAAAAAAGSSSTSATSASAPGAAAAAPPPVASSSSRAPAKKKAKASKVDVGQGRLAFGKPGEGWKIEKAPLPLVEEDATPPAVAAKEPSPNAVEADVKPRKAPVKGKGKGKAAPVPADGEPAPKPKAAPKGGKKGKVKGADPEADEIEGMATTATTKAPVKGAARKPKKGVAQSAVTEATNGSEPLREHASQDLLVMQESAGDGAAPVPGILKATHGASSPCPSSDPIAGPPVAGPSKPRKKSDLAPRPPAKAAPRRKRPSITVLSSGSESEGSTAPQALRKTGSAATSIIITEDEVEAASDASTVRSAVPAAKAVKPSKNLHPFFGSKPALPLVPGKRPQLTSNLGGSSAELAIDLEAEVSAPPKPTTSFFASRLAAKPPKPKAAAALEARWPTREETLFDEYAASPSGVGRLASLSDVRRSKMREGAAEGAAAFWAGRLPSVPSSRPLAPATPFATSQAVSLIDVDVPDPLAQHPAFARLADQTPAHTPDLWADRFRPLAAAEVLGNEDEAVYLRDWLVALQVKVAELDSKGKKTAAKRQVVRKVDKSARKRLKKAREDDWIVDDDQFDYLDDDPIVEDNGSPDEDSLEDLKRAPVGPAPPLSPSKLSHHYATQTRPQLSTAAAGSKTATYPPLATSSLANSILLVGPSGAGKTAAVYACAHELDWDVFEVYPGVRRSGTALGEMVGEVGKNHLVGRGGTGGGGSAAAATGSKSASANALTSLLQKSAKGTGFGFVKDTAEQQSPGSFGGDGPAEGQQAGGRIRQSCILLEEVDILFPDDKGFWAAVVSLISESRRPIIMTCNDISAVPLDDLPLQATLVFLPPPLDVATPYLQLLSHAGGLEVEADTIEAFHRDECHHSFAAGVHYITGHPAPSQPPDAIDLRRTTAHLQTLRGTSSAPLRLPSVEEDMTELRWDDWETRVADWATSTTVVLDAPMPTADQDAKRELQQLVAVAAHLDGVSFANAHVDWRPADLAEVFDPDRFATSDNDPVDYDHLLKPAPDPLAVDLPEHGFSRRIAYATLATSRSVYDQEADRLAIARPAPSIDLLQWIPRRRAHLSKLLDVLEPLIEAPAPLLPSPALILDYVPIIQAMVQTDDILEAEDKSQAALGLGRGTQGRVMRASAQAGMAALAKWTGGSGGRVAYQRQLYQLAEEFELQAARETRLDFGI